MTRAQIQADFVREFHKGGPLVPVTKTELDAAERNLGVSFPEAYRAFMAVHGPVSTPSIPQMAKEADVLPVVMIPSPEAAVTLTRTARQAGLKGSFVAFACGPDTEIFCFERNMEPSRPLDDAAVWHFDPQFDVFLRVKDSFDEWLEEYLQECYMRDDSSDEG